MKLERNAAVRAAIQTQSLSYRLYIDRILEQNHVKDLISGVSCQVQTFVFSGLTRNFLLGYLNNRDIDFVVIDSPRLRVPLSQLREVSILKNKFGGYKVLKEHLTIDVWDVEKTWGIMQEGMRGTVYSLMNTAFFNFSAIVFDYNKKRFYITDEFCKFYKTHVMEVVYAKNPRIATCIVNSLYYADKYEFVVGNTLRKWLVKHYDANLDFKSAQESRFGVVRYSDAMIKAFVRICTMSDIYRQGLVELCDETQRLILRFDKG